MSAMPHAHQMEQVLESLAAKKAVTASQKLELQPQWRLVSRDGSTSSVNATPPEAKKHDCPDCLAGRCGQNPQGCRCSDGGNKTSISLDRLTGIPKPDTVVPPTGGLAINAAMPQAKPQLFEPPSKQSTAASFLEPTPRERPTPIVPGPIQPSETELRTGSAPLVSNAVSKAHPPTTPSVTQPPGDELQRVIDHWPRLPGSTRRAILALVGVLSEADSA